MSSGTHYVRPRATLRLQLHAGYTLDNARTDLPYFSRLGVSHLYLSPVSRSRPGSTHGYDVVDHTRVDPDRGGEAALRRLSDAARGAGMGLLLDIVPNHMATDPANAWWWDVLMHGERSAWAQWFDIDWQTPVMPGKVLAPFLEKSYGDALCDGDIRLRHDSTLGLHLAVGGAPYPLAPETIVDRVWGNGPAGRRGLQAILDAHDPGREDGRQRLHVLLSRQHYRLAWWRHAAQIINWRRFFEVSGLIGVRVERDDVFEAVHALPLRLYAEGIIDGLRIDHVDGLARPLDYCRRLRGAMREADAQRPPWIVVEKILADGEVLDERWQVSGTTGYDFAADVGALLHDGEGRARLFAGWAALAGDARTSRGWLVDARREMLERHFVAERDALLDALLEVARQTPPTASPDSRVSEPAIGRALDALLCHYPTYRSYVEDGPRTVADQRWFDRALRGADAMLAPMGADLHALLRALNGWLGGVAPASDAEHQAVRRFQQLTPPLAAKALEDTVFYRYGSLLSRNEVGSDPDVFALSVNAFHQSNSRRAELAPDGLLATATHDHKRGEDVRARLAVLSEIPDAWLEACRGWLCPAQEGPSGRGAVAAFRYMLLQMLVGAWPSGLSADDAAGVRDYFERLRQWGVKALREGKQISSWFEPDIAQETICLSFLDGLAPGGPRHEVLRAIESFVRRIEPAGIANSLIQTALRLTCPGVPDLYQGTEFPDFSLVDPDNRGRVDFEARARMLDQAGEGRPGAPRLRPPLLADGWPAQAWTDGRIKQALIAMLLQLRRDQAEAFTAGYRPLTVGGGPAGRLLAFSRGETIVVVAGGKCASRLRAAVDGMPSLPASHWAGAMLHLPAPTGAWRDVLRGRTVPATNGELPVAGLLAGFPLAVLCRDQG